MTDTTSPTHPTYSSKRLPHPSPPVLWWVLINEMEAFTAATGWGLASIWSLVHRSDYEKARARFDELRAEPIFADRIAAWQASGGDWLGGDRVGADQ